MYHLHSYFDSSVSVAQPDCVYKMKSVHADGVCCTDQQKSAGVLDPEVGKLEVRQEAILKRLSQLQEEVNSLSKQCVTCDVMAAGEGAPRPSPVNGLCDIVVSASPSCPPLSLFVLQQLLSRQYRVLAVSHVHSSIQHVGDKLRNVFGTTPNRDRGSYQFVLTVIWKDVACGPVMVVSPKSHAAICGEASIARHLARLLSPTYDSDSVDTATRIDAWIDLAMTLINGNSKEKAAVVRNLNGALGKSDWLVGGQLTVADVVMWSALQQSKQAQSATGNVKKWVDACNSQAAFQLALTLVS